MAQKRIGIAMLLVTAVMLAGFAGSLPSKAKNLKVLPKDISDEKLDSIMESYNKALGVDCQFCHTKEKDGVVDFSSDDNPMKEVGRKMIRLTIDINQKYFNTDSKIHPAYLTVVKCYTCHKGDAYPQ